MMRVTGTQIVLGDKNLIQLAAEVDGGIHIEEGSSRCNKTRLSHRQ
jgi:hypothetical protein